MLIAIGYIFGMFALYVLGIRSLKSYRQGSFNIIAKYFVYISFSTLLALLFLCLEIFLHLGGFNNFSKYAGVLMVLFLFVSIIAAVLLTFELIKQNAVWRFFKYVLILGAIVSAAFMMVDVLRTDHLVFTETLFVSYRYSPLVRALLTANIVVGYGGLTVLFLKRGLSAGHKQRKKLLTLGFGFVLSSIAGLALVFVSNIAASVLAYLGIVSSYLIILRGITMDIKKAETQPEK